MKTAAIAALGVVVGLTVGGCWGNYCDELPASPPLESAFLSAPAEAWGSLTVDDTLDVDIDVEMATVTVMFQSEGREVVEQYRITATQTF
jgi:hypothetical protein